MKNTREDRLQKLGEQAVNLILLGFFWTLTSIPIFTIGAASTALSESTRSYLVLGDKRPLKTYLSSFKKHFRVSTLVWLIHLVLIAVFVIDLLYYSVGEAAVDVLAMAAVCVLLTILVFEMEMVFTCIAVYEMTGIRAAFAQSMDLTFTCFLESFEMLVLTAGVLLTGIFLLRGILPFAFGIISYLDWKILPGMIAKYNRKRSNREWSKNEFIRNKRK